jgi:hypothetical protein
MPLTSAGLATGPRWVSVSIQPIASPVGSLTLENGVTDSKSRTAIPKYKMDSKCDGLSGPLALRLGTRPLRYIKLSC